MSDGVDELPLGWTQARLADVVVLVKDKIDPQSAPDVPYVGLEHIESQTMHLLDHGRGADVKSTKTTFCAGDVLYGKLRPYLNKVARPDYDGICSTDILVFRESDQLDAGYLANFLNQLSVAERAHHLSNGMELPRIGWTALSQLEIAFPESKAEQQQVVRLIGDVRGAQADAVEHLKSARRAIERFRQAVLATACSGRLTADWRREHSEGSNVRRYIAAWPTAGKRRRSNEQPVDLELPDLPESYVVVTVGDAAEILEYGTSKRCDAQPDQGVPVLRMGNIQGGTLSLDDLKYCRSDNEIERLMLRDGDLLFNRTNSPELVGKSAVFHGEDRMSFASYLIRVQLDPKIALPEFVNYWINSAWGREWARLAKTDGVSQSNINGSKLALMPLPLPPIEEQRVIVARVSRMLSAAGGLTAQIDRATRDVERSSQAMLAKAFRGEYMGVASNDASALILEGANA